MDPRGWQSSCKPNPTVDLIHSPRRLPIRFLPEAQVDKCFEWKYTGWEKFIPSRPWLIEGNPHAPFDWEVCGARGGSRTHTPPAGQGILRRANEAGQRWLTLASFSFFFELEVFPGIIRLLMAMAAKSKNHFSLSRTMGFFSLASRGFSRKGP